MIISVIGSGGKTTYIHELKDKYVSQGKTVLMCTTTHMLIEEDTLVNPSLDEIMHQIEKYGYCHAGNLCDDKKICALDLNLLNQLKKMVDVILIEADGSKHLPLKYPNEKEPVIDLDSDEIVLISNLKGLGNPVKNVIHRYTLMDIDPNELVTPKIMQDLIRVYLKKLDKPVKIHVNGDSNLYTRCLKTLLEEDIDVDCICEDWFKTQPKLVILGCGHVSQYLAKMASILELYTIVIDNRIEFANKECFPNANEIHCMEYDQMDSILPNEDNTCYVIVTRGHKDDRLCLEKVLWRPHLYLGMIGSKGKVKKTFDALIEEGYSKEKISQVHAPIGLDIRAQTPAEISISILAQLIEIKNAKFSSSVSKELLESNVHGTLCIIIEKKGSAPRGVGSMMLVYKDGIIDTIGGGKVEYEAILDARACKKVMIKDYNLSNSKGASLGMICGGYNKVLFIPV